MLGRISAAAYPQPVPAGLARPAEDPARKDARCRLLAISAERLDRAGAQFREAAMRARRIAERRP